MSPTGRSSPRVQKNQAKAAAAKAAADAKAKSAAALIIAKRNATKRNKLGSGVGSVKGRPRKNPYIKKEEKNDKTSITGDVTSSPNTSGTAGEVRIWKKLSIRSSFVVMLNETTTNGDFPLFVPNWPEQISDFLRSVDTPDCHETHSSGDVGGVVGLDVMEDLTFAEKILLSRFDVFVVVSDGQRVT